MVTNAFVGKPGQPTEEELAAELGSAKVIWDRLLAGLAEDCALQTREWHSYSRKAGWSLRLKKGDRNIVYLSPGRACFMASFALGEKAMLAAKASKLPEPVLEIIDQARRYAEGSAVRLEVRGPADIAAVKLLVAIKMGH